MDMLTYALLNGKISTVSGKVDAIPSPFNYQGSVTNVSDLPASSTKGYLYTVTSEQAYYVYDGSAWTKIGGSDNLFIATQGTTTYAQVLAAYNAGKVVVAKATNGDYAMLSSYDTTSLCFYFQHTIPDASNSTAYVETISLSSTDGWFTGYRHTNAGDVDYSSSTTYRSGTVGKELTQQSSQIEELTEPHPYAYDGVDLKAYFGTATALHTALRAEDYSHINNGDYYPITFSGTYRDYGEWVALSGTSYYSDTACTQKVGELSEDTITTYDDASPAYYKVTVSGTSYYVKMQDCQRYREKTINSLAKMEANINPYWEYGDSGELSGKKPHICWIARDGITTAKFCSTNQQWADAVEQFETGDGSTATYTPSDSTLTCVRYVCVNGTLKTYNTHYTVNTSTGAVTFKTGSIPAAGDAIIISRTTHDNPWVGSAIYKTLNDADYGLMQLIDDSTFASFILDSMRYYGETRSVANSTSGAWANRGKGFLPTEPEVWGEVVYGTRNLTFLPQLPVFSMGGRRHIMKGSSNGGSRYNWWVASSNSVVHICNVDSYGFANTNYARSAYSLVPGFVSC